MMSRQHASSSCGAMEPDPRTGLAAGAAGDEGSVGRESRTTSIRKCSCAVLRTPALHCIRLRWRRCVDAVRFYGSCQASSD